MHLLQQKLERIQFNASLVVTEATPKTPKAKRFEELGLESLRQRRWYRKLCCFYRILKD